MSRTVWSLAIVGSIVALWWAGKGGPAAILTLLIGTVALEIWRRREHAEAMRDYLQRIVTDHGEEVARLMVIGDPWRGATQEMVMTMCGPPDDVSTRVHKQTTKHVWKYVPIAATRLGASPPVHSALRRYALRISFENGVCVGWQTA